jgi:hypothetical protein
VLPSTDILTRRPKLGILDYLIPGRRRQREREMVAAYVADTVTTYGPFVSGSIVSGRIVTGAIVDETRRVGASHPLERFPRGQRLSDTMLRQIHDGKLWASYSHWGLFDTGEPAPAGEGPFLYLLRPPRDRPPDRLLPAGK